MLGYLSAAINCSEKRTVFLELRSRKTVSYEEQIMSKVKYPSIFSLQMGTIVFIILQILFGLKIPRQKNPTLPPRSRSHGKKDQSSRGLLTCSHVHHMSQLPVYWPWHTPAKIASLQECGFSRV